MTPAEWRGWASAVTITLITVALVICDITDSGFRHWWLLHALTTDTVSGLLVVLVTVLVVNQVVRRRQLRAQSRAISAQAAIMLSQAERSARAVSAALAGSGERDAAADEFRTYMMMLLVGAPVLIDSRAPRTFLERAQRLGGEMALALNQPDPSPAPKARPGRDPGQRLNEAVAQLKTAAAPLLATLNLAERTAAAGDEIGT